MKSNFWIVFFFILGTTHPVFAKPSEEVNWLACQQSEDCTSVELGCWYWQPVNKSYARAMKEKYNIACRSSLPPGPQPTPSCVDQICVNVPYTGEYWEKLESFQQNTYLSKRIDACLEEALIDRNKIYIYDYGSLLDSFRPELDRLVSVNLSMSLESIVQLAVSCEDAVKKANDLPRKTVPGTEGTP